MEYSVTITGYIHDLKEHKINAVNYSRLKIELEKMVRSCYPYQSDSEIVSDIISQWTITAMRHDMMHYKPEIIGRQIKDEIRDAMKYLKILRQSACKNCGKSYYTMKDNQTDCMECIENPVDKSEQKAEIIAEKKEYFSTYQKENKEKLNAYQREYRKRKK